MVKITTTNIVGTASKTAWSQAQTIDYGDDHQMMFIVRLNCDDDDSLVDLASMGVEIIAEIERRGQGVENTTQLKELVNTVVQGVTEGLKIEILIGSFLGEELLLRGRGSVEAYLARDGKLAKLRDDWGEGESVQGVLKEGDVVVGATSNFVEVVGLTKLRDILTTEDEPAELLAPLVHTQAETSLVAAIVAEVGSDKMIPKPKIKLRSEAKQKMNFWVGVVIFLMLVIMIGVGMVRRVKILAERDFASLSTSVNAKIEETLSVGDLNPERARILLSSARREVDAYLATKITDEYRQKGSKLIGEIDSADERAFKKNDTKLSMVVELSILVDGLQTNKMKSDGKGNLIFIDAQSPKIVLMNLVDRSRQIIEGTEGEKYVDVGVGEGRVYGLNTSGVSELFWKKTESKKIIEPDEFWKDPTYIEMFAGNAYILDKGQREIWKYPTLGETFGGRRRWFAVSIAPDLSNVVDMKVVGDIWLLTSSGKLERYSRGAPVVFGMEGFPAKGDDKKLSEPSALWVSDSLVYVLENGASRVVVFTMDGKYQSQYVTPEFAKATDLVVVDDKGYVMIDNMVKEFGL